MYCIENFLKKGREVERRFADMWYATQGGEIWGSDTETDMKEHIDVFWRYDETKRPITFDVKGPKKDARSDEQPNYDIEWIEFQNVNGDKGWVCGNADYIVFECLDDWIIIGRAKLKKLVEDSIVDKSITHDRNTWFRFYQRLGNRKTGKPTQDKVVRVPTSFIRKNADRIVIKYDFVLAYSK